MNEEDKRYFECERCGNEFELNEVIKSYVKYKNGLLCLQCARIRSFDDNNPILYPIYEKNN